MKKIVILLLCLVMSVTAAGCGNNSSSVRNTNQSTSVNAILEAGTKGKEDSGTEADSVVDEPEQAETNEPEQTEAQEPESEDESGIDLDLTELSATMVYSEVYNMMVSPEDYVGKTVKMDGQFTYFHDEENDNYYFACIIQDATACCAQGIEFVLTDDYTYPDDYPEVDEEICVVGVFDTYLEDGHTYCTLRNASLL